MKKATLIVLVVLVALCGFGGFAAYKYMQMQGAAAMAGQAKRDTKVEKGDLTVQVVETGQIDAVKAVEVKSRVSGRVAQLLVDEGATVQKGQLIAIIDPQETQLRVQQDQAQKRGAEAAVRRLAIEIAQRQATSRAAYNEAATRLKQIEAQMKAQPTLTRTAIASADASLDTARRERDRLVMSAHPSQRVAAESSLREARASLLNAEQEYERQKELVALGYAPGRQEESAKLQLDLSRARLDSSQEQLDRLAAQQRVELDKADASIRQAEAEAQRAKANAFQDQSKRQDYDNALSELRRAETALRDVEALRQSQAQSAASVDQISSVLGDSMRQLGETEIRAPIDGVVTRKYIQEGELVASLSSFSSGTPIVRIEDRTAMMVKLSINEIDVAKLRHGMEASVTVDAYPDRELKGVVKKIAPSTQEGTTNVSSDAVVKYQVEVWLTDPAAFLKSGMSAKCTMIVQQVKDALQAPSEFVGKDDKGAFVLLKPDKPTDKPTEIRVKTGIVTGAKTQLLDGVKDGQAIIKPDYKGPTRKGAMQFGNGEEEEPAPGESK
ncbi:MAG: efflux RND transporter periplasmic adaptor subunit [Fimbriimonadaceae bacterium]|nr:efflux RND transporter periplasmic adaptor subunit [Fimbriimonadaceae bacterium]